MTESDVREKEEQEQEQEQQEEQEKEKEKRKKDVEDAVAEGEKSQAAEEQQAPLIPDFTRSSDEDEDENVFTEEYLNERKAIFEKDMRALQAELPPPPLEDPIIVELLLKIQLLGMIADGAIPGELEEPVSAMDVDKAVEQPATVPYKEENGVEEKLPAEEHVTHVVGGLDKISIASLPFLNSGPPTPLSDLEVFQENIKTHERFKETLREELAKQKKLTAQKNAELREEYIAHYKPWRLEVYELDRQQKKKALTPGSTTPPEAIPVPEGRRHKGNTELDFQNALKASAISAQQELERRREMEATAKPDLTREAEIPDMLEPHEKKASVYQDTNNIVDPADAFEVFSFYPPPDDFTPEEHKAFTDAFMAYPKKWGKIAEELPGRDFQQCIMHYYLTKEEIKYKAKLNKRWTRRGRARRSTRNPKSNALMADLGVVKPEDGEEETPAVTDTGRPRRAAAPTFGESSADNDHGSGRRGHAKDGDTEKPTRRGGRTGPGSRGGRRGKAAQQQQQQQHQQQLEKQQQEKSEKQPPVPSPSGAPIQPLVIAQAAPVPKPELDSSMDGAGELAALRAKDQHIAEIKSSRTRGKENMHVGDTIEPDSVVTKAASDMGYGSLQPTSYWSVPEQRDFPVLLAHFGKDFEGISNFMKTKTTIMVSSTRFFF